MNAAQHSMPVVITGSGIVCALGSSKAQVWPAIARGECGIGPLSSLEQGPPNGHDGGEVRDAPAPDDRAKAREVALLRRALHEALAEAGIGKDWPCAGERVAIILGTTLGGMRAAGRFLRSNDLAALRDFNAASVLQQALAGLPATGLATTTCAACASGLSSVALGVTLLREGGCDMVIAGGYDPISEYAFAGFSSLRVVTQGAPRPFSRDRQGMKLGEGYAVVVMERADAAQRRHVRPLAVVAGFGESSDAHHLTQPEPSGNGAARAMQSALRDAGLQPHKVDLISAHATATPNNDAAEFAAYQRVWGDHLPAIPVVAFKSHLGHTLGGAGTVELVLSLLAMRHQVIPPTATVCAAENEFPGLNLVVNQPRSAQLQTTLNLSMGFGGANACIVLRRPQAADADRAQDRGRPSDRGTHALDEVFISGVGVLLPGAIGNDSFLQRLRDGGGGLLTDGALCEDDYAHLFEARRARRLSACVKLMLAATSMAIHDAGVDDPATFAPSCGAILGATHGSTGYSEAYYRQVASEGMSAANPMLFAEGVPNVLSAQLSLMLGLKGGAQTLIGSCTAGLEALCLAHRRIASGACERLIVGAAEERSELVEAAWRHCGSPQLISGSGAVALVVESGRSLNARVRQARGRIVASDGRRLSTGDAAGLARASESLLQHDTHQEAAARFSLHECLSGMFSVAPLVETAAALLDPSLMKGKGPGDRVSVLATDPLGLAVAVMLQRGSESASLHALAGDISI